jgi:L-fuculose-phosphate aldolase
MRVVSKYYSPTGATESGGQAAPSKEIIMHTAGQQMAQRAHGNWTEQQKLALARRILADEGHGASLAGQVTCRADNRSMWTQPYGLGLEEIKASDYLLINEKLEVVEGSQLLNPANNFHLHIYAPWPDVNCIIHTHPPHTAALSMIGEELVIAHMDVMCFYNAVTFFQIGQAYLLVTRRVT